MIIHDRLYGEITLDERELKLLQTPEFARLRQVSLSSVPPWTIPAGACADRAEHSVGVAHLTRVNVARRPDFRENARDLFCAALAHDIAAPPFSHLAEHFMQLFVGKSHEQYAADVLDGSEFAREVRRFGASLDTVISYVLGTDGPAGELISGEVDFDNCDNSARYATSLGLIPSTNLPYSPARLAEGFMLRGGRRVLSAAALGELAGWAMCRVTAYAFAYSPANLGPNAMLYRAIGLAAREGRISRTFFRMRDDEAYSHLENSAGGARLLAERARRLQTYPLAYSFHTHDADEELSALVTEAGTRMSLADDLADALRVEPEDVAVYAGQNRAFKRVMLPVIDEGDGRELGTTDDFLPRMQRTWLVQVYLKRPESSALGLVSEFIDDVLRRHGYAAAA
ncbi:MAG: HD domain-containing protein [Pyrinomonadaceae bacterium]